MKHLFFVLGLLFVLSCTEKQRFDSLTFEGINIPLDPVILDLKDYTSLEHLFEEVSKALFDEDLDEKSLKEGFVGYDLTFLAEKDQVEIAPFGGADGENRVGDRCSISEEDGVWKSYEVCENEDCVKMKLAEAADDLKSSIQGKCLRIRVRRTDMNAQVCAQMTPC